MINSETNTIELMTKKQPVLAPKKVALRDVQNNNISNLKPDLHQETLLQIDAQSLIDSSKTSGNKRLTPDYTSPPFLTNNAAHEHFSYPRRKYEFEGNKGKNVGILEKNMGSKMSVSRFKEFSEEQRTDRFIRLQNFIKQCDGSNNRENIQLLLRLSPSDLSRHAVELEKRAIQLTIEEGKEMQRMQALNILGKPSTTRNQLPITQHKN